MKTITYNPETHVLVPREPTRDMVIAGTHQRFRDSYDAEEDCFRAMIEAAPQPEPVESEHVTWMNTNGAFNHMKKTEKDALHVEAMSKLTEMIRTAQKPQPDRTAELEAALKVARDALNDCEGALDECRDYPITYDAILEALAKINKVLKP